MGQSKAQIKTVGSPYYRNKRSGNSGGMTGIKKANNLPLKNHVSIKKVLLILTVVSTAFILLIWLQIQIDTISGNVQELNQNINDQQSNNNYKKSELEKATTYEIIYPIVKSKFNMDFPESPKIILPVPEEVLTQNK